MNNLDGQTVNIGKLFSKEFFFKIPDYQRPFSWDEDNFEDLIGDILSAEHGQQYFLGTLVLHRTDSAGNYAVVDGQQRLTSLMILIACIRDLLQDDGYKIDIQEKIMQKRSKVDGIPEKPRLEVKDREVFKQIVLNENGTNSTLSQSLPEPEYRYVQAMNVFKKKLSGLQQIDLQKLIEFISQRCVVIYLSTSTFDDAFRLFTIVNDRGKQLRRIDILKAENISPDVVSSSTVRDRIAQKWEQLEKDVGEAVFENILHFMRLIYVKEKPQGDLLKEFETRVFKKGLVTKGEKFVDEVFEYVKLYREIFIDRDVIPDTDGNYIRYRGLVHIMDNEFLASEWRACVIFFAKKFKCKMIYEFLLAIEKVFLEQWVKGVRKDERFSQYASILQSIEKYSKEADVIANITSDKSVIESAVDRTEFYGAGFCKYYLLRLELLASEHDVVKEFNARSIEHVFPQNPSSGSLWLKDPRFGERDKFVNSLGNLVLLSKGKNSSASNYDFEDKKQKYLKSRVTDYPRSVQVLAKASWDIKTIEERNSEVKKIILQNP